MATKPHVLTTLAIASTLLLLGLPTAITTLILDGAPIPSVVLGTKTIDAGPNKPAQTLSFGLRTGPNDAVRASAYLSILTATALSLAVAALRHVLWRKHVWAYIALAGALGNLIAQVACVVAWGVLVGSRDAALASAGEIVRAEGRDGGYEVSGERLFTRESWACSLKEREGWAAKACDDLRGARMLTLAMVMFAVVMGGVVGWQVYVSGKVAWCGGRRKAGLGKVVEADDGINLEERNRSSGEMGV